MSCTNCGGSASKSGGFAFIGNNTIVGQARRTCPQGFNYPASYYEVSIGGDSAIVKPEDFNKPFSIGGHSFQLNGEFLRAQIFALQEGSFDLLIEVYLWDHCKGLIRSAWNRTISAYLAPAPEPETQSRSIEAPTRKRKRKAKKIELPEPKKEAGEDLEPKKTLSDVLDKMEEAEKTESEVNE